MGWGIAAGRRAGTLVVVVAVLIVVAAVPLPRGRSGGPPGPQGPTPARSLAAVGGIVSGGTLPGGVGGEPSAATPIAAGPARPATPEGGTPALAAHQAGTARIPLDLARHRPNEAGLIPILEYHAFTTDPAREDQFTHLVGDLRDHLVWLHAHGFYVVPLRDVLLNRVAAPPGKHPVALTFDDSTAGQFRFLVGPDGTLVPDPNSAVGVMEEVFAAHPDLGRGGHFAVLPSNCFHFPDEPDQEPYCDDKLRWLVDHGYEVGNHTLTHADLSAVDDEHFRREIASAMAWIRERIPEGSSEDILTMPFGAYPHADVDTAQWAMLRDGFTYEGQTFTVVGALMVGSEPAYPPGSRVWDPHQVPRVQMADAVVAYWWDLFETQPEILYTSDGDPDTVTVPKALPTRLDGTFDPAQAEADGKTVVRY